MSGTFSMHGGMYP